MQIQRKEVEDHLQTSTTLHMELTLKNLKAATEKLDSLQKQVQELTVTNSTLRMKVDEQSKTIARLNEESSSFVWKVTEFWKILRQAKNERNKRIKSEPFYAGRQGYKLRLCIEPDGNQSKRNRYLSVYILLMKGGFDGMLPWPFRQKVTFTLIDQKDQLSSRFNVVRSLYVTFSTGRPLAEEVDESQGIARFISHSNLSLFRYVVDDTLFIHVKIDPIDS